MAEKKTTVFILVALSIGVIGGYLVTSFRVKDLQEEMTENINQLSSEIDNLEYNISEKNVEISDLKDEIDNYEDEISSIETEMETLKSDYELIQESYTDLQKDYTELSSEYEELTISYKALQETYELYNVNLYKEVTFNIKRQGIGHIDRSYDFDVGYGIIVTTWMRVNTETTNVYISAGCSWTRGGECGFLGSSSRTYSQLETTLTGYAYCKIFDSGESQLQLECGIRPRNQTSWHGRESFGTFPKEIG